MPVPTGEDHSYFVSDLPADIALHSRTCSKLSRSQWWRQLIALLALAIEVLNCEYSLNYRLWRGMPSTPSAPQRAACFEMASLVSAYLGRMPAEEPAINWATFLQKRRVTYQGQAAQHACRLTLK